MVIASLFLAVNLLLLKQPVFYNFFSFSILALAAITSLLKPRYAQYCYFFLSLIWFFLLIGFYFLYAIYTTQVNPYAARMLPTVISILLPIGLVQILIVLFLGVAARVWFDKPIQDKRTKVFLNITFALAIASLSWLTYFLSAGLRPRIRWIADLHYSWSTSFFLILCQFTFGYFLFSALPLAILSSFVKNWSKWQAVTTSLFVSIILLLTTDRMLSFLVLESRRGNLYIAQFFVSIALLLSTYYLSKYIQKKFINTKYHIGFD